jgi:3-mercaptopyruvate sulfurtransferase SseA
MSRLPGACAVLSVTLAALSCARSRSLPEHPGTPARAGGEMARYLRAVDPRAADGIPRISPEAVVELQRADRLVLVDVRSADRYREEHALGAINIPLSQIEDRGGELPSGRRIVAYCT